MPEIVDGLDSRNLLLWTSLLLYALSLVESEPVFVNMHVPKVVFLAFAGTSFALATPRNFFNIKAHDEFALAERDAQAANIDLIQDTIAKTGYDLESDDDKNITHQEVARLSADDAQLLATELNTYSTNNNQTDLLIPAFSNQDFEGERDRFVFDLC
ncbi:hypothetical protein PRZ48_006964 [Zasmidium cellare]|uniref:Uncharacterized protein n=1 Tax=Zasmidium cellare TaxID=395010 RepID=A0ABR0EK28_ZASCE|nr:hypothetical protein PRZ48_006964 [Zasmidium cellare]